jgi:hypothetical protein
MIYDVTGIPFRAAIFEVSMRNFPTANFKELNSGQFVPLWLNRNRDRIHLRLFTFVESVLNQGFLDPVIIWGNIKEGTMRIHPGTNMFTLYSLIKDQKRTPHKKKYDLNGWVVDFNCNHRDEYQGILEDIKPIPRDADGNRNMEWFVDHRTTPNGEDQYELSPSGRHLPGNIYYFGTKDRWEYKQESHRGFGCWYKGVKFYDIGRNNPIQYEINTVSGIYQLFLEHFFDWNPDIWQEKHYESR